MYFVLMSDEDGGGATWGASGSMPYDLEEQYDVVHKTTPVQQGNMPSEVLEKIKEKLVEIVDLMQASKHPPEKNDSNREKYAEIMKIYNNVGAIAVHKCNPDVNEIEKTPSKMLSVAGRAAISAADETNTFYIYTIGFNHPSLHARNMAYTNLTNAIASPNEEEVGDADVFFDGEVAHTFYEWRWHKKNGRFEGYWGPGPPWKPAHFQMIWERGRIPSEAQKPVNIPHKGKTWADAYGHILDFGPYEGTTMRELKPPSKWVEKFNEVFEIRHLRKLGMSYQDVWKREKGYTTLAAMVAGKGHSKSFHSMRAFTVNWTKDTIKKRLTGKKNERKVVEDLRRLTAGDVEHGFHRDFYDMGTGLNKWEERSASVLRDANWSPEALEYNTKYEYIFNMPYVEVQQNCNQSAEAWFLHQQEKGNQDAKNAKGEVIFYYRIDNLIWLQENLAGETKQYEFNPILGERLEGDDKKVDSVFDRANSEVSEKGTGRKSPPLGASTGRNSKKVSVVGLNQLLYKLRF
jgi:hypothetical protein